MGTNLCMYGGMGMDSIWTDEDGDEFVSLCSCLTGRGARSIGAQVLVNRSLLEVTGLNFYMPVLSFRVPSFTRCYV